MTGRDRLSTDENGGAGLLNSFSGIGVNKAKCPDIGSRIGNLAPISSIPALRQIIRFKHDLAITVIYFELKTVGIKDIQRIQVIVKPVIVGRKCPWYSDVAIIGKNDLL